MAIDEKQENAFSGAYARLRDLESELMLLEHAGTLSAVSGQTLDSERRLDKVIDFAGGIITQTDLTALVDWALARMISLLEADHAYLWYKESSKSTVEKMKSADKQDIQLWDVQKFAKFVVDFVVAKNESIAVAQVSRHPLFGGELANLGADIGTIAAVPIYRGDSLQGVVYFDRKEGTVPFSRLELKLIGALIAILGRALGNASFLRDLDERRQQLEMVNRLYKETSKTLSLDQTLEQIASITLEVTKAERTVILMMRNDNLIFAAGRDGAGPLTPAAIRDISRSVVQKVLQTKEGVYVFDAANSAEFAAKKSVVSLQLNAVLAVPLMGQSGLVGVLYVDSKSNALQALEKELAVLSSIGHVASMAIDNAKLFRQATVDGLTGLFVRSYFLMRLDEEIQRCNRYKRVVALLVMDIDHFKKFNDTYGHQTGDEVIKLVCNVITQSLRAGLDVAGRYGGEELVVFLPETDAPGAMVLAERIRHGVETAALKGPKGEDLQVKISIGVTVFPAMADNAVQLFERADQALYASKQNGRNRATLFGSQALVNAEAP